MLLPSVRLYAWQEKAEPFSNGCVHAKVAVADRGICFITSANLTGYAMEKNMEAGVLVRGGHLPDELHRHLEALVWQLGQFNWLEMDTVDRATRSKIMASVGQRNTGAEMKLRKALHRLGLRYRLHDKRLPGSPDLVCPRFRAVIFVHGCFWHRHNGCKATTFPKTRQDFWAAKFETNIARDQRNIEELQKEGWRVAVVWECALKGIKGGPDALAHNVNQDHFPIT